MKRVIFLIFICFFLLSSAASAQLMDSAWPMFGGNLQHTGQSPYISNSDGTVKWTYTTGSYIDASPVISTEFSVLYSTICNNS